MIQKEFSIDLFHRPGLSFCKNGVTLFIQQMVRRLPLHRFTMFYYNFGGNHSPIVFSPIHKVISAVYLFQTPVKTGLMWVMRRTKFRQRTIAIGRYEGMYVRSDGWVYMFSQ